MTIHPREKVCAFGWIAATVRVGIDKPPKKVSFRITYPNSCSLKYDDLDLRLREMLSLSGIEPKPPAEAVLDGAKALEA